MADQPPLTPAASEAAERKTFRLSARLSVEMTVGPAGFTCEWSPDLPADGLTRRELRAYRRARDEMLARLSDRLGGDVVVIEP